MERAPLPGCNAADCAVLSDGSDESDVLPKLIGSHSTPASERMPMERAPLPGCRPPQVILISDLKVRAP